LDQFPATGYGAEKTTTFEFGAWFEDGAERLQQQHDPRMSGQTVCLIHALRISASIQGLRACEGG